MPPRITYSLLLLLTLHIWIETKGQVTILKGSIFDNETKHPISFVSLSSVLGKDRQYSNENGAFSINVTGINDTLYVSSIGYESKVIPITLDMLSSDFMINLNPITYKNSEVIVHPKKYVIKKLGINHLTFRNGGYLLRAKGSQFGRLFFINDSNYHYLKNVRFHYGGGLSAKGTKIRLRIYSYNKSYPEKPGEDLLHTNVIITVTKWSEWVQVDLEQYNVLVKQGFIVGIELLTDQVLNQTSIDITANMDEVAPTYSYHSGIWKFRDVSYKQWNPWIGVSYIE